MNTQKDKWNRNIRRAGAILLVMVLCFVSDFGFTVSSNEKQVQAAEITTPVITTRNVEKKLVLKKGTTFQLRLNVDGKKKGKTKFYYQSSNTSVIAVSNKGLITANKKGTASISVHLKSNWNVSKTIKVVVGKPLTSIRVTASPNAEYVLPVGFWTSIKTKVYPKTASYTKLKWTSSNPLVAKVTQKGNIKGLSTGTTMITAVAQDSSKLTVTYSLKVGERVSGIVFSGLKQWQGMATGTKKQINYQVTPETAVNKKIIWESSNPGIMSVDEGGMVTALSQGAVAISAKAADGSGVVCVNNFFVQDNLVSSTDCNFVAHRGFSSEAPENTLAAFVKAGEYGFWGAECDVQVTMDGELVISHDSNMSRMFGVNQEIGTMTLAQIKQYKCIAGSNVAQYPNETMPTLAEYLNVCRQYSLHPVIEIKEDTMSYDEVSKMITQIKQYFSLDNVVVISFYTDQLGYAREIAPTIPIHYLSKTYSTSKINTCIANGYGFDCEYTGITVNQINSAREKGIKVHLWTLDDKLQAFNFIQYARVDFITTNYKLFD